EPQPITLLPMQPAGTVRHPHLEVAQPQQLARQLPVEVQRTQLPVRTAEQVLVLALRVDQLTQPRLQMRCWGPSQTQTQQLRQDAAILLVLLQTLIPLLPRSMAIRLRRSPLPLDQAGKPRQQHRPISEISTPLYLRPQAPFSLPSPFMGPRP